MVFSGLAAPSWFASTLVRSRSATIAPACKENARRSKKPFERFHLPLRRPIRQGRLPGSHCGASRTPRGIIRPGSAHPRSSAHLHISVRVEGGNTRQSVRLGHLGTRATSDAGIDGNGRWPFPLRTDQRRPPYALAPRWQGRTVSNPAGWCEAVPPRRWPLRAARR